MFTAEQLFKILGMLAAALAVVFLLSLALHKQYQKIHLAWRMPALFLLHLTNCLILMIGFFAAEHLHAAYIQQYHLRTEVIHDLITFSLLFLLGLPFIYFYIQSQTSLNKLEEENRSHKLDILNFMNRVMEELPEDLREHSAKTGLLAKDFCSFLKIKPDAARDIIFAATFHHVGSAFVRKPDGSLPKVADQDQHADLGAALLHRVHVYKSASEMIRHHHEKWDGTGTPNRLKGLDIPLGSRIIAIAGSYDQILNGRNGMPKLSPKEALAKLGERRGLEFDPDLLDHFNTCITHSLRP